jgi:L-lactate dehydrogenase complex protein LldG
LDEIAGFHWMGTPARFPTPSRATISKTLYFDLLPLKQSSQPVEIPVKQTMEQDQSISKDKENKTSSIPDVLEHFRLELTAIGGEFTLCQEEELFDKLVAFLNKQNTSRLQAWEPAYLPYELLSNLKAHGIQVVHEPDDSIVVGLTGVLGGIAETGTLIIPGGPGRPLTASLLPEIHIAVLKSESIRPTWVEAMQINEIRTASSVVMVSGPSRTADIEMTLTVGVHGPRQVHVFCV